MSRRSFWSKVNWCPAFRLKPTSGAFSELDLKISRFVKVRLKTARLLRPCVGCFRIYGHFSIFRVGLLEAIHTYLSAKRPKRCRRNVQNVSSKCPTCVGETSVDQQVCRRNVCRRNVLSSKRLYFSWSTDQQKNSQERTFLGWSLDT